MGRPSFRRRKFFIKKEFQGKFIAIYTAGVFALAGITTLVLNRWLHTVINEQLYSSHMKVKRTGEIFLSPLIQTNLYAILAISVLVLFFSILVFKRLNRHFVRMDKAFEQMANGDYASYDPPTSHFEEINEMINMVRQGQKMYAGRTQELMTLTGEIESAIAEGCPKGELISLHERLVSAIDSIQLPEPA